MCPKCNEEFELPLRHISERHPDDEEYMRLPRILPCLHTICQACLERDRDRSSFGKVVCCVCHRDDIIKGVKFLPLNVSSLVEVMEVNKSTSISYCSRCIEQEGSYSWCVTCSTALCELHHNDHEVSNGTGTHEVIPFDDINAKGVKISPKLPQVICPEEINCVCSCYCFDCMHLLSSEASLSKRHANHTIKKCVDIIEETKGQIGESVNDCLTCVNILNDKIQSTRNALAILESNSANAISTLEMEFSKLREEINERERVVKEKINSVTREKSNQYYNRLNALEASIEDCNHVCSVAEGIVYQSSATPEGNIYVMGAVDHIVLRVDDLMTEVKALTTSPIDLIDPRVEIEIDPSHIDTLRAMVSGVGHLKEYSKPLNLPFTSESELPMNSSSAKNNNNNNNGNKDKADSKSIHDSSSSSSSVVNSTSLTESYLYSGGRSQFFVTSSSEAEAVSKRNRSLVPGFVNQTAVSQHVVEIDVRQKPVAGAGVGFGVDVGFGGGRRECEKALVEAESEDPRVSALTNLIAFENSKKGSKGGLSHGQIETAVDSRITALKDLIALEKSLVVSGLVNEAKSQTTSTDAKESSDAADQFESFNFLNKSESKLSLDEKPHEMGKSGSKHDLKDASSSSSSDAKSAGDEPLGPRPLSVEAALVRHGGALTGKVIVSYELDKRLSNTFELRSFYESYIADDGCPVMKVTKSIVPK
jgi:hypothetical protein